MYLKSKSDPHLFQERDNQKKMAAAEAAFTKEWMKPREDLELADSKDLPTIPPVTTLLPVALFGDVIQVFIRIKRCLFVWVSFNQHFPTLNF